METVNAQLFSRLGSKLKEQVRLAPFTTYKIGGPADFFFEAQTKQEFILAVKTARELSVPLFVLGGGSNILVGDKGFRGLVIRNLASTISIVGMKGAMRGARSTSQVFVEADAGVVMNKLVRFAADEGLAGLEMHLGLPGSVGGAIYMNSKWTHPEGYVGNAVYQATIITKTGQEKIVPQSYFRFAYDSSSIQQTGDIVVCVVFCLLQDSKERLWQTANDSIGYRRSSQPQGIISAGCTFRNLSEADAITYSTPNLTKSAGFLLDKAGLKGKTIGKAQISTVHANFFVNLGGATASDMVQLIRLARDHVKAAFGVTLEEEIIRVGEF